MIYLCTVYTQGTEDLDPIMREAVLHARYVEARDKTAEFMKKLVPIFSPIVHCHDLALHNDMPKTWDYWEKIDFQYLDACKEVWVYQMPGWEQSRGIQAEIEYAKLKEKPVKYIPYKSGS